MTIPFVLLFVAIVGLLLFAFAPNGKAQTVGDRLFFAGILASLLQGAHFITIR